MKRTIYRILCFTLLICICFTLCSCKMLDEMKAQRVLYADSSHTTLIYEDNLYKAINNVSDEFAISYYDTVTISDADVPLLLTNYFGTIGFCDKTKTFIEQNDLIYCREDAYDFYSSLKPEDLTHVCFETYNEEYELDETILAEQKIISTLENIIKASPLDIEYPVSTSYISLYLADEKLILKKDYLLIIKATDGNIYVSQYNTAEEKEVLYGVEDSYYKLLDTFIEKYSYKAW
ncbi:MAG: hypothetical protein U0M42_04295 [Acutalibacteraceae bacterium]|nr:hypothetical protein [Acutalibacteraceae bacterium]